MNFVSIASKNRIEYFLAAFVMVLSGLGLAGFMAEDAFELFWRLCMCLWAGIVSFRAWRNGNSIAAGLGWLVFIFLQPLLKIDMDYHYYAEYCWGGLLLVPAITYFSCRDR